MCHTSQTGTDAGNSRADIDNRTIGTGVVAAIAVGAALVTGVWNDVVSWLRDAFVSDVRLPI